MMQKRKITKFCNNAYQQPVIYAAHLVISIIVSYFYKDQIDNASM